MRTARIWGVVALLVLSACSGAMSREEYIEEADRLCAEADAKTRDLEPPKSPAELEEFAAEAQDITGQLLDDLRDLEPPEEGRETIEQMLSKIEEAMGYLPDIQQAAAAGNTRELSGIAQNLQSAASEANRLAQEYGFERCGQSQPAEVP